MSHANARLRPLEPAVKWLLERPWRTLLLSGCAAFISLVAADPASIGWETQVEISEVAPETGHAFVGKLSVATLSSHEQPSNARLWECRKESPVVALEPWLGDTYVFRYLKIALPLRFPSLLRTVCSTLSGANAMHQAIRDDGEGLYSVWHGYIYFSTTDNSDPRFNGRTYEVRVPYVPNTLLAQLAAVLSIILAVPSSLILGRHLTRLYSLAARRSALFRNVAPSVLTSSLTVLLVFGLFEAYLRATTPFVQATYPTVFDPRTGIGVAPRAVVQHTNGMDFWVITKANSFGFLDREPNIPKPTETFRILLIGDSFVEAAQVDVMSKSHVLLEQLLNERFRGSRKFDAVAMGQSGTGQANQLAYCETFGDSIEPDLIVLLFVFNDFANNSALLEAVRHGWHPQHPARLFFEVETEGTVVRVGPDPGWADHLLPVPTIQDYSTLVANRVFYLRQTPAYATKLGDWDPPNDLDEDYMFYAARMPPAFEDALVTTAHAIGELSACADRHHAALAIVKTHHDAPSAGGPRQVDRDLAARRLSNIADARRIPLLDLSREFERRGAPSDAVFRSDGHWNETGHRWAAEAMLAFLEEHPRLIRE